MCFLRGTTADEDGNISMEQEAVFLEMTSMAQAAHNPGAPVVVQVKRIARAGTLPAKTVKIPGMLVDFVVVEPGQWQTYETEYSPAYAGELKIPLTDIPRLPLDERKVIARRAALELHAGAVCNLGSGIATGIANVAAEEDALDAIVLRVYGAGAAPADADIVRVLHEAIAGGKRVVAVSQCETGGISPGAYASGAPLWDAGVEDGGALTPEAALASLWLDLSDGRLERRAIA